MNKLQSLSLFGTGLALGLVPLLVSARGEEKAMRIEGKTVVAASELKWTAMKSPAGAEQAALWGDPAQGPHRILYRWPAGAKAPLHTHTHGERVMVVSGALSLGVDGAAAKRLPSGSFFSLAGGVPHETSVDGTEPCLFYLEREGAFDVNLVETPAKK